jgi:hypothetical protein
MKRSPLCIFMFVLIALLIILVSVNNAFAQKDTKDKDDKDTKYKDDEGSFIFEYPTYLQLGFQINSQGIVGEIPVQFFSSKYAPGSGFAFSIRYFDRTSYGAIGFHWGLEGSIAKARIYWHTPELGISYPEMESKLTLFDMWLGFLYAPFLLHQFPLRPYVNFDGAGLLSSLEVKLNGEEVNSNKDGLADNRFFLKYGIGIDLALPWKIGVVFKYQRYLLRHSRFEPEKGAVMEGDHRSPYLLSIGLFIYG